MIKKKCFEFKNALYTRRKQQLSIIHDPHNAYKSFTSLNVSDLDFRTKTSF